jgi:integrase
LIDEGIVVFKNQMLFKTLLHTGTRYAECQRLKDHSAWFDGNFIHLPSMKIKAKQKKRWIRLTPQGKEIVKQYLYLEFQLPTNVTWNENLQRWATNAGLDPVGISAKSTRKTWESWLAFYYPTQHLQIVQSQGHDARTAFNHYLNMPFTDEDKMQMKEFVEGWI